jgi:hypothetical protein
MSWSKLAISLLQQGQEAKVRPRGHSMTGKVNDGNLVTISPCDPGALTVGDVVLVKVSGSVYLHLIKAIDPRGRFLIGNNRGGVNGWAPSTNVYGVVTQIEP